MHLVTVVGLDVVKLGDVDGLDPGEAARQLRHRLAAELGDVLGAGVHLDEPLGHLLQGQRLAGLGAVPQHLATAAVLEELQTLPGILLFNNKHIDEGLESAHRHIDRHQQVFSNAICYYSNEVWFGSRSSVGDLHSWRRAAAPPAVSGCKGPLAPDNLMPG